MTDFRLLYPFALLMILPLLGVWVASQRRSTVTLRYSSVQSLTLLTGSLRVQLRWLPDALRWIALIIMLVALARPQIGFSEVTLRYSGVDIVFTIDISDSMATQDFNGLSRLDAAKKVTSEFITARTNDKIGLVVFSEDARYLSPPTLHHTSLLQNLERVTYATELGLSNRSAIGVGTMTAASLLRRSDAQSRVVVLLTDGANNAGLIAPTTAAMALQGLGIRLYTIGMGAISADTDLDEPILQSIALLTGGRYFNALRLQDLHEVYQQINTLEKTEYAQRFWVNWQDIAPSLLILALITMIIEQVLRRTLFETIP